jgi:hypothetical protein
MVVRRRFLIGVVVCIGVSSWSDWYKEAMGRGGKGSGAVNEEEIAS